MTDGIIDPHKNGSVNNENNNLLKKDINNASNPVAIENKFNNNSAAGA